MLIRPDDIPRPAFYDWHEDSPMPGHRAYAAQEAAKAAQHRLHGAILTNLELADTHRRAALVDPQRAAEHRANAEWHYEEAKRLADI